MPQQSILQKSAKLESDRVMAFAKYAQDTPWPAWVRDVHQGVAEPLQMQGLALGTFKRHFNILIVNPTFNVPKASPYILRYICQFCNPLVNSSIRPPALYCKNLSKKQHLQEFINKRALGLP